MSVSRILQPGERVGPFEIERHLASGGMGAVYVARSLEGGGELVALKVLFESSVSAAERFEREARIADRIEHPHIVAGRGSGRTADGTAYLAMELLTGRDLESHIRAGISAADTVAMAIQVCSALSFAHSQKIVHRDLKPQNIFMCQGPVVNAKVVDFGIARVEGEITMTRTGAIIGTWAYMSPEQARGDRALDHRTDVWSLGVVMYECLAGRIPFESESGPGTLFGILMESPPDLAKLRPELPRGLVDVVNVALRKDREQRFESADAMSYALVAVDRDSLGQGQRRSLRPMSAGTDDTLMTESGASGATALHEEVGVTAEVRLTSVVFVKNVRDAVLVESVAAELGGRVVQLAGKELLIVFGMERWIGDEPFRAVRLAAAVNCSGGRIGVATGRVLRGVVRVAGAAVNAAVALATVDGVRIDSTTASAVRGGFELSDEPGGTSRLVRQIENITRGGTQVPAFATPLLGREVEHAMLLHIVERARTERRPTAITVVGVAGIGKSRLMHEAAAELRRTEPDATCLVIRGDPAFRDAPFVALREALAAAVDPGVAALFSHTTQGGGDPVAVLDRARASLDSLLQGFATRGSVLMVIDDVQWLDASSRATLRWIVDNAAELPLALWVGSRPEARDVIADIVASATSIDLGPLPRAQSEKLLQLVVGSVPAAVIERAGGHPLFLEELGRLYAERGAASLTESGELPLSVEGALLAQLDLLDPLEREFLKRAAVFGNNWWLEAVVALGGDASALKKAQRQQLVAARPRSRLTGIKEFGFRTGILQEVAYGLWTEPQRESLHERAASWLSERPDAAPGELARHWELAGNASLAAVAHANAAEAAARVADTAAACTHAARVLELTNVPELRWRALVARDDALQSGNPKLARDGIAEMVVLAESLAPSQRAEAAWRQCYFARITADPDVALAAGRRAIELAAQAGDQRAAAVAHRELAMLFAEQGRFEPARVEAVEARRLAGQTADPWLLARTLATLAFVVSEAGSLVEGLELMVSAADEFARVGDRRREAACRSNASDLMVQLGRMGDAASQSQACIEAAHRVGNARAAAVSTHNLGVVQRVLGDLAKASALQNAALKSAETLAHPRLASYVAIERAYLALASDASIDVLLTLADGAEHAASNAAAAGQASIAAAVALRARARAGLDVAAEVEALRERRKAAGENTPIEIAVALYEAGGRTGDDARLARAAIETSFAAIGSPADRIAYMKALRIRLLIPEEVVPSDA